MADVKFSVIVDLLNAIAKVAAKPVSYNRHGEPNQRPARDVFKKWLTHFRSEHPNPPKGTTAIIFKLLFPECDTQRKYNMQEKKLGQVIADALGLHDHEFENWHLGGYSGTLGLEVWKAMRKSATVPSDDLTLREVDAFLDELAAMSPFSDEAVKQRSPPEHRKRVHVIRSVYSRLNPDAAAFLTEIILKDLIPILYRVPADTHWEEAILKYNTRSFYVLTKDDTMWEWDRSGSLWNAYRQRASIEEACRAWEECQRISTPRLHVPIAIPKTTKGTSAEYAINRLSSASETIWAEIKYDGERAQIHMERGLQDEPRITIFSKSQRNSTDDRVAVHSIAWNAVFGLLSPGRVHHNVILEAEMVAFDERESRVDEFWRVRHLVETTAVGARGRKAKPTEKEKVESDNVSLKSDDDEDRHLALVFFDILYLDNVSFLDRPYNERRRALESILREDPGYAMLSQRIPIPIHNHSKAQEQLNIACAEAFAQKEEGLVLKADNGCYNDRRSPWVKMKRDYIHGVGDSLKMVLLGAGWSKKRAAGLHVTTDVLTTYYLGTITDQEVVEQDPTVRPHFEIYSVAEYGPAITRQGLDDLNFWMKNSAHIDYLDLEKKGEETNLFYDFTLFSGLRPPRMLLERPLLVDVYGAGFTVSRGYRRYELRFPRLTKVHRDGDWRDGVNRQHLHALARAACGRDHADAIAENEIGKLWKSTTFTESVRSPANVARRTRMFYEKLTGKALPAKRRHASGEEVLSFKRAKVEPLRPIENVVFPMTESAPAKAGKRARMRMSADGIRDSSICHLFGKCCSPWSSVFHVHRFTHDFESLLRGCGWIGDTMSPWAARGILVVEKDAVGEVLEKLKKAGADTTLTSRLPIWILHSTGHGIDGSADVRRRARYILE